ncbi:MAG: PQQ-binding-like beta-propeller repeat protein, partial [Verrucomicrobia bacterium]|nr:PQQ-binding-like beta-propeller repeat protein [Verrucomicrobiota bacterium]
KKQNIILMDLLKFPIQMGPLTIALGATLLFSDLQADIPVWRGDHNGIYHVQSAPTDWQGEQLFEIPLESKSNGTPILVDGRLIFTAEPDQLICMDSQTGKVLWQKSNDLYTLHKVSSTKKAELESYRTDIDKFTQQSRKLKNDIRRLEAAVKKNPDNKIAAHSKAEKQKEMKALQAEIQEMRNVPFFKDFDMPPAHQTNGYTSYSPHYDGERIYAQFGFGVVVAYDLNGNRLWTSFLEHPDHNWGGATMPQIIDGKLIIRFDNYMALDPTTGEKLWSTPSEVVFGTPVPFQVEGEIFMFTPRGEIIRVSDGKLIKDGLVKINKERSWAIFNTPANVDGVIFAANGVGKEEGHAYAYRIPTSLKTFNKKGLELVWHTEVAKNRYYSSPLVHEGLVYLVGQQSIVSVLDASNGEIVYTHEIKGVTGTAYPTMVLADNKIYQSTEDGNMVIFKPGRTFEEITRHKLGPYRSTPIFNNQAAYLRTYDSLIAVGKITKPTL